MAERMCLILFAYDCHPRYKLIVVANRDEYYYRHTAPAAFWEDCPDLLAGRDLEQMGTWLGITKSGRFAALTNYRDPSQMRDDVKSRGHLVSGFLCAEDAPAEYLAGVRDSADEYNGYNLLVSDGQDLYYYSNMESKITKVSPGIYGLSNHLLDTPWPKVQRGKQALAKHLQDCNEPDTAKLLHLMTDRQTADDADLPKTGVSLSWERLLSSMFIQADSYGTRSSTVLLLDRKKRVRFIEKTYPGDYTSTLEKAYEFNIS